MVQLRYKKRYTKRALIKNLETTFLVHKILAGNSLLLGGKFKRIATITGVIPPYREGELSVDNNLATGFYNPKKVEKNLFQRYVNGGFMVFNKKIFSYLSSFNECKLETEVFSKLISDKQLAVYPHYGFWKWLDTDRDFQYLNDLVDKNKMYWLQE